jgi:hypothetical protein
MPFGSYQSIADVARTHRITCTAVNFVVPMRLPAIADSLKEILDFALKVVPFGASEFAARENLIYPVLREVWKHYLDDFTLWNHEPLVYDEDLSGTPDYFLAKKSPLGHVVVDQPYLLVIEAKRDDFTRGWGQCLAAMLAAQKLNAPTDHVVYGIVTTGRFWQFGKLGGATFTQDLRDFTLSNLDELCAAIRFVFEQCRLQLAGQAAPV